MTREFHPVAEIFPMMSDAALAELGDDIRAHGLREPIWLHQDGRIIDGRNRYQACELVRIEPQYRTYDGADDKLIPFVVSLNLHRRHLNESQRSLIATKLATLKDGQHKVPEFRHLTQRDAAALLNVSRASVQEARVVLDRGTDEEIKAVESGTASVHTIGRQIRKGENKDQRKKRRDAPLSQSGRNPERIQKIQMNAEIWGRVRDALTHLTSLPLPADVVAIVRANDKAGHVDARLAKAIQWIGEFEDAWTGSRREDAA